MKNKLGILIYKESGNGYKINSIDHFYDKKRTVYSRIIDIRFGFKICSGITLIKRKK
jgi:hypothetical protein